MGETTKGDATKPSPNQISSPKDSSLDHQTPNPSLIHHHHHHQSFLPSPIFIPTVSSPGAPIIPKRPRFGTSGGLSPPQWKALPSPSTVPTVSTISSSPTPSTAMVTASSTETAGSSPPDQEATNSEKQQPETESFQHKFRKGKYVSPVWKPNEMLWLARAWRVQYQNQGTGSGSGSGSGEGRGKTRAEKDREVAEFLNRHGINRDSKIAGTKWDNMLGEFRKVYEWEKSGDREKYGKSYFRLSPYERKQYRLPASFDEEVFQELALFMGPRVRAPTVSRGGGGASTAVTLTPPSVEALLPPSLPPPLMTSRDEYDIEHNPITSIGRGKRLALSILGDDHPQYPYSHSFARGSGLFSSKPLYNLSSEVFPSSSSSSSSVKDLRRVGKIRLTWEESVNLWAEEGEVDYGRIRVSGSSFLNADELTYLDESMVACTMESFEDGPLKGFSLDKFISGQHIKVFGRQKSTSSSAPSPSVSVAGFFDRGHQLQVSEPVYKSISTLEFQDPSEHCLSKLRVPAGNLPTLFELARYLQEPPPENLRFPLRRDVYNDLPQGKELFFYTSSTELLDSRAITYDIIGPIMSRLNPNNGFVISSKDSLIPLWHDSVNRMVSKFCEMVILRKPDSSSCVENVQDQWPNVTGFVKGFALWRGEETDKVREGVADPSSLLVQKILWSYHDLPYILGYHAIGFTVTFCALSRSSQDRVICTDLYSFDVSSPSDRVKALVPCYRIASLLPLLADRCTTRLLCYNDFERISHGDYVTEMTPHTVTKYYSSKRKWSGVKGIYDFLGQRVPHAEHLDRASEKDLSLSFKPRGIRVKPRNVDHLIESLMCVTRALVALHDLSFMHRDMGWDNVMKSTETSTTTTTSDAEWFICGFDAAVESPQLNPHRPAAKAVENEEEEERGRHAPEMERGLHAVKVDVWGVGYMIKTCGLSNVPKMLRELQKKCLETNQENRPTAADCFHHLLQVQSASSSSY
ncbi:Crinkler effector protein 8 [Cardamine amara subsp. amara]|uniref:Crinkler effector protein 8 n=1 Tax=Cardamine amara subsp. amara TaxID=228776 RepID=A0ABD1BRQ5_CARAN